MDTILFIVFLAHSAFFSSSETAFLSIGKIRMKRIETLGGARSERAVRLLSDPHKLLITILVGNTIVNIAASSVMTDAMYGIFGEVGVGVAIIIMTLTLLIAGEVAPKMFALKNSVNTVLFSSNILIIYEKLFFPARVVLEKFSDLIVKSIGINLKKERPKVTGEEIRSLFSMGRKKGLVKEQEKDMVDGVLSFKSSNAADVMTPRIGLVAIDLEDSIDDIIKTIKDSKFSRYPAYIHSLDNIVGIVHAKDILLSEPHSVREFVRKPLFVPESMKTDDLLQELRSKHKHMAVVTDEYGVTSGVVTIEDILEEIVGEIRDELDQEKPKIRMVDRNTYEINGQAHIDEVNEELGTEIDTEQVDTIGGYFILRFGKIPSGGDTLEISGFNIEVLDVSKNRVTMLRARRVKDTLMPEFENEDGDGKW